MIREMEQVARRAITMAGDLIRDRIGNGPSLQIKSKAPLDYVTEIDLESQALIIDTIRKSFPDHHIVSEEGTNSGVQDGFTWIIDPLDGTTNFIHGFPFVAVSIGLCKDRSPILGLVLDPVRQELFTARRGEGAYLNGRRIQVRGAAGLADALIATGFPFRRKSLFEPYMESFRSIFLEVSGIRRAGAAALDLAYLAAGRVDGFWEAGLAPWDIAAGSLLVEEAGGCVSDFWGKQNHLLNGHIVAGTGSVYPFLLEQVQKFMAPVLEPV